MSAFTIGQLAKATGTAVETVRYYEKIGLLPAPPRTSGNYRSYGDDALQRLSFARRARDLGFSLDQVRALLSLADDRNRSCAEVDALASRQLATVDQKIADLQALRHELAGLIDQCSRGTVANCLILEALRPAESMHNLQSANVR
jgi:Cu(I)-responsive transcriptional regulator